MMGSSGTVVGFAIHGSGRRRSGPAPFVDEAGVDTYGLHAGPVPSAPKLRVAREWMHAVHPDSGLPVTFQPGEALPDWLPESESEQ